MGYYWTLMPSNCSTVFPTAASDFILGISGVWTMFFGTILVHAVLVHVVYQVQWLCSLSWPSAACSSGSDCVNEKRKEEQGAPRKLLNKLTNFVVGEEYG